jgi:hypothetical protein
VTSIQPNTAKTAWLMETVPSFTTTLSQSRCVSIEIKAEANLQYVKWLLLVSATSAENATSRAPNFMEILSGHVDLPLHAKQKSL